MWKLIAKALGEKAGKNNKEADKIAFIRLLITLQILLTNFFIIFGVTRTHIFPMKQSAQQQIEEIAKELNGQVQYTTVLSKTYSSKQIVITYDERRRHNGGTDSE